MLKKMMIVFMFVLLLAGCAAEKKQEQNINAETLTFHGLHMPYGGLGEIKLQETNDLSEEEVAEVNRAMRAYSPSSNTPLINNAKEFYYYSQLGKDEKDIYDALMMLVEDPVDPNNVIMYSTEMDLNSDEFLGKLRLAYYSVLYDHPELFWLYNDIKASVMFGTSDKPSSPGFNDIYFYFEKPYETFREDVEKFNKAAEEFLADIDLNQSETEIALAIHDKLINMVTYDNKVLDEDIYADLAHTAYGALVENSRGDKNTAVCDGYSLAYEYLLQQAGLEAAVLVGNAGGTAADAGGHAWSIVKIDDTWYEVDSCWDDFGTLEDELEDYKSEDIYPYYKEALSDEEYRKRIEHYLYRVSTDTITDYVPGDEYVYYSKDGKYKYSLIGEGVHIRASEVADWVPVNELIRLAPIAR